MVEAPTRSWHQSRLIPFVPAALHAEIERTPVQHRALLLRLLHSFREGVEQEIEDVDTRDSLRWALDYVRAGETQSVKGLWDRAGL